MTTLKTNRPTNRSSLYKEVNSLRTLSTQEPPAPSEEDDDSEILPLLRYIKWVGLLSILALLVGFCAAAITR
jgi:hypothetical protein